MRVMNAQHSKAGRGTIYGTAGWRSSKIHRGLVSFALSEAADPALFRLRLQERGKQQTASPGWCTRAAVNAQAVSLSAIPRRLRTVHERTQSNRVTQGASP